jgi:hypothetical protein
LLDLAVGEMQHARKQSAQAVEVAAGPAGHLAQQPVHFLVEVRLLVHARSKDHAQN